MGRLTRAWPRLVLLISVSGAIACDRAGPSRSQVPAEPAAIATPTTSGPDPLPDRPATLTCADGDGLACRREAEAMAATDRDAARGRLERGCALDDAPSCTRLGAARRRRAASVPDDGERAEILATAVEAFEAACRLDDPEGCGSLAIHLHRGEGTVADPERARALLTGACDREVADACRNLGLSLQADPAEPRQSAVEAMQRACRLGDGPGCAQLGHYRYAGTGVPRDLSGALEAYRRGCEAGFELACRSAENLALEVEDSAGPWARGMVLEKDGARVVVQMQSQKPIPVGETVTVYEWAIRNEVRAWVEVGDVKIRSREGDTVVLWIQEYEPDLRTDDYYPLLPKAGIRLQWTAESKSGDGGEVSS